MSVKIKVFATLKDRFGFEEMEVREGEFREIMKEVAKIVGNEWLDVVFDKNWNVRDDVVILINGRNIRDFKDVEIQKLKDGDVIAIFPPIAGGFY